VDVSPCRRHRRQHGWIGNRARILLDYCERVTIVDRDTFSATQRRAGGCRQDRHLHVFLMRGLSVIDRLFPAFIGELAEAGALILDPADDFLWINPAGTGVRFRSEYRLLACSRDLLIAFSAAAYSPFRGCAFLRAKWRQRC